MSIFEYWSDFNDDNGTYIHPKDRSVLEDSTIPKDLFDYSFPPGPYFGPLKTASIVFLYGNPGIDENSINTKDNITLRKILEQQLSGNLPYPELPGWKEWFSTKFSIIVKEIGISEAARKISVMNIIPYASKNMDALDCITNCLPSTWQAQEYLRYELIPKAERKQIFLIVGRCSSLWGLKTNLDMENIIINHSRNGIDLIHQSKILEWVARN